MTLLDTSVHVDCDLRFIYLLFLDSIDAFVSGLENVCSQILYILTECEPLQNIGQNMCKTYRDKELQCKEI